MNEQWFKLSIQQIEEKLKTNAALGLSQKAARSRVNKNAGDVFLTSHVSPLRAIGDLVSDFSWILLLFAAVISLFFEDRRSGVMLVFLLFVQLLLSFVSYHDALRTNTALSSYFFPKTRLIRKGKLFYSDARRAVPGDVILIEAGDILCCDARLIQSDGLVVNMRVDQKNYVRLEKYAEGFVPAQVNHPKDMVNMIHAGSIVEKGSARAIVTSVGKYTYLGALTGGIRRPEVKKITESVKTLQKKCAKWNTGLLLAVFPLSIISLCIGHFFGGTVLLSSAFVTYMSVAATGISYMVCTSLVFFYTGRCRRLSQAYNPSVIRSAETLERLADVDYLFVRDGAAFSDGMIHFTAAMDFDGDLALHRSQTFWDVVGLYYMASTGTLSMGLSHASLYQDGLAECLKKYSVDIEALRIRSKILSYLPGNLTTEEEKLYVEERGRKSWISISTSLNSLQGSVSVLRSEITCPLSPAMLNTLTDRCQKMISAHHIPLIFKRISEDGVDRGDGCLLGILFFREGIDENVKMHIRKIEELGCRVIFFSDSEQSVKIPFGFEQEPLVSKHTFLKNNLPITYQFGRFRQYTDVQAEDIEALMQLVHSRKKKVALLFFDEQPLALQREADVLISCAPIHTGQASSTGEMVELDSLGQPNATTCKQVVKEQATILIPRPMRKKGGFASIVQAILSARRVKGALHNFLRYMLSAQVIRMLVVFLPMLLGKMNVDARHVLFCSCVMDVFAFFICYHHAGAHSNSKNQPIGIRRDRAYLSLPLRCAVCAFVALILPLFVELFGVFGPYMYQTEYLFLAMILLHLSALVLELYPTFRRIRSISKNYLLLIELVALALFLSVSFLFIGFGSWFGMEKCPLPYALTALIPSILLWVITALQRPKGRSQKAE